MFGSPGEKDDTPSCPDTVPNCSQGSTLQDELALAAFLLRSECLLPNPWTHEESALLLGELSLAGEMEAES